MLNTSDEAVAVAGSESMRDAAAPSKPSIFFC